MKLQRETIFSKGSYALTWDAVNILPEVLTIPFQVTMAVGFTELRTWLNQMRGHPLYRIEIKMYFHRTVGPNVVVEVVDPKAMYNHPTAGFVVISDIDLDGTLVISALADANLTGYFIVSKSVTPVAADVTGYECHLTANIKYGIP